MSDPYQTLRPETSAAAQPDKASFLYLVSDSLEFFKDHFPKLPVMPAYAVMEVSRECSARAFGKSLQVVEISRAKITQPISPGVTYRISVKWSHGSESHSNGLNSQVIWEESINRQRVAEVSLVLKTESTRP